MKGGVRQSNAWLHSWAGLLLGWLMFAIFLMGTISFFRQEVTHWMQPELHRASSTPDAAERGVAKLAEIAPDARRWSINLPTERNNTLRLSWETGKGGGREGDRAERGRDGGRAERGNREGAGAEGRKREAKIAAPQPLSPDRIAAEEAAKIANARGGRPRPPTLTLDPATGTILTPRDTAGGEFLYRFHYQLHSIPRDWGRWIVGIATFAMFVALISGIITHKKIFRDFFTFRRNKGQRSWLDGHNAVAVLSIPFHLMITFSGLLLLGGTLLPWGAQALISSESRKEAQQAERAEERRMDKLRQDIARQGATALPISDLVARAEAHWQQPVGRVSITSPGRPGSTVDFSPQRNDSLLLRAGGGAGRTLTLNAANGEILNEKNSYAENAIEGTDRVLSGLHLARFASPGLRWLLFIAGVMGTIMVGTGLVLWSVKRAEKRRNERVPFGHKVVEHLNIAAVAGLMVAIPAYFWMNRLVPAQSTGRADTEIAGFFLIWALTFLHPFLRSPAKAWRDQIALGGLLFVSLPVLNGLTGGMSLFHAIPAGNWLVAGFDLVCLLTGVMMLATLYRLANGAPRQKRVARPSTQHAQPAE